MTAVDVTVFKPDATTPIGAAVPRRDAVRWQDEQNGTSVGAFELHLDDQFLTDNPTLLDGLNIVKMRPLTEVAGDPLNPDPVYAWQIEEVSPVLVGPGENADRKVSVSGRHVRSLLEAAQVLGEGSQRGFDFSAVTGPWYVTSDWTVPNGVRQDADTTARANSPAGWPDGSAQWLWASDPLLSAPTGWNWFRSSFTLATQTDVKIWASFDNVGDLRVNGQSLITTDWRELYQWRQISTAIITLPAGTHQIAAKVYNLAQTLANPGGFLCVVGTADDQGGLDTVIRKTDTTNWLVHDTVGVGSGGVPGWHAAQILIAVLTEAQAAGELNAAITWDFADDLDSNGDPWTDRQDVSIPVGEDLLSTSNRWAGTVYDIHMTPDLVLQAFIRRGSDVSATVELAAGDNVTALSPTARYGQVRNVIRFLWDGIWHEITDAASIAVFGRRPTTLSFGDAGTLEQAEQAATDALVDLAWPQVQLPVSSTSAKGPQPYADYDNGSTISAPALFTGQGDARVMVITAVEQENHIQWTTDLYPET